MEPRNVIAIGLITLGGLIALANWFMLFQTHRTGHFRSAVPIVGGGLLVAGMLMLPTTRPYAWTGVLLDYGTLVIVLALPRIAGEAWGTSRFNLLKEYVGQRGIKTVSLRLFRNGAFTIMLQHFDRPRDALDVTRTSTRGRWRLEGDRVILEVDSEVAALEVVPDTAAETLRQTAGFPGIEGTNDLSLAGIDLRLQKSRSA